MSHPELRAKFELEATVSPSEDPARVAGALQKVLGGSLEAAVGNGIVTAKTEDIRVVSHMRDQLRDRHVRSAARRRLLINSSGRTTYMMLNRQAAAAGVVAICGGAEESPLGPIYFRVESDQLPAVIDWLTAYE